LLLLSSASAEEFSLVSTYDTCDVSVTSAAVNNQQIEDQLKSECSEVPDLSISGQGVLQVPTGYCSVLPNLTRIKVEDTPADRLDDAFKDDRCQSLKYLLLTGNKLSSLPVAAFRALKSLDTLELSYNRLSNLVPDTFTGLEQLTSLGLLGNGITQVPADLFKPLKNLEVVSLSENKLKILDLTLFASNAKLVGLSCNECGLTSIIPPTSPLYLETLQLKTNQLTNITVLNRFTSLTGLELANNSDLVLNDVEFATFPNLTSMNLGQVSLNRYASYQNILPPTLIHLYMPGNNLGTIDLDQLRHLRKLDYLNVEENGLKTLNFEGIAMVFPKLTEIDLSTNEFSKEQIIALKEFLTIKGIYVSI
jgi:Leucine-rich repeat (LRR) protein